MDPARKLAWHCAVPTPAPAGPAEQRHVHAAAVRPRQCGQLPLLPSESAVQWWWGAVGGSGGAGSWKLGAVGARTVEATSTAEAAEPRMARSCDEAGPAGAKHTHSHLQLVCE